MSGRPTWSACRRPAGEPANDPVAVPAAGTGWRPCPAHRASGSEQTPAARDGRDSLGSAKDLVAVPRRGHGLANDAGGCKCPGLDKNPYPPVGAVADGYL